MGPTGPSGPVAPSSAPPVAPSAPGGPVAPSAPGGPGAPVGGPFRSCCSTGSVRLQWPGRSVRPGWPCRSIYSVDSWRSCRSNGPFPVAPSAPSGPGRSVRPGWSRWSGRSIYSVDSRWSRRSNGSFRSCCSIGSVCSRWSGRAISVDSWRSCRSNGSFRSCCAIGSVCSRWSRRSSAPVVPVALPLHPLRRFPVIPSVQRALPALSLHRLRPLRAARSLRPPRVVPVVLVLHPLPGAHRFQEFPAGPESPPLRCTVQRFGSLRAGQGAISIFIFPLEQGDASLRASGGWTALRRDWLLRRSLRPLGSLRPFRSDASGSSCTFRKIRTGPQIIPLDDLAPSQSPLILETYSPQSSITPSPSESRAGLKDIPKAD